MFMTLNVARSINLRQVNVVQNGPDMYWIYTEGTYLAMDNEAARELVRQLREALGGEIKADASMVAAECLAADQDSMELTAAPAEPDPRGYVFVDRHGEVWGWSDSDATGRECGGGATRPFATEDEACAQGADCLYKAVSVVPWWPECGVPPMPAKVTP